MQEARNTLVFRRKVLPLRWRCNNCQISFVLEYQMVCQRCQRQIDERAAHRAQMFHRPFTFRDLLRLLGLLIMVGLMFLFADKF